MKSTSALLLATILILSVVGVTAITAITIAGKNDATIVTTIIGFLIPIITSLVAYMVRDIHKDINSRMDQFLELTGKSSFAEGKLEGKAASRSTDTKGPASVLDTLPVIVKIDKPD